MRGVRNAWPEPEKENEMFGKAKAAEADQSPTPEQPPPRPSVARPAVKSEAEDAISSISSSMMLVGKLVGDGEVQVFGRLEGEIHAATVLIANGAIVEGNIVAQELTVGGRVKGTIHGNRVVLNGTAVVEGDIFHRSLAIEENARFEGSSRREDHVVDTPPSVHVKPSAPEPIGQPQVAMIDGNGKFNGVSEKAELHPD
jgi:cytoskeletal protein CcmA (bactofilin family)